MLALYDSVIYMYTNSVYYNYVFNIHHIYFILGQLPCRALLDPLIDRAPLADFRSVYPIGDYIW